jgi:hypothetical protein
MSVVRHKFSGVGHFRREGYVSIVLRKRIIRLAIRIRPTANATVDSMITSMFSLWIRKAEEMKARNKPT